MIRLPRGQQAVGNKVSVCMVNSTDQYQTVVTDTIVGRGAITQEREDLAKTLSQVGLTSTYNRYMVLKQGGRGIS